MKALYRILAAAVAVVATAGIAHAQAPSDIVNGLEVKQLVAANTPEANASLAKHFTALAEAYTADAAQHQAMARAYVGNPNHSLGNNVGTHCTKLAELATESATAAREMATYHEQLAAGVTATVPKGAAGLPFRSRRAGANSGTTASAGIGGADARGSPRARRVLPDRGEAGHRQCQGTRGNGGNVPGKRPASGLRDRRDAL